MFPTDPPHSVSHGSTVQCFPRISTVFSADPLHSVSNGSAAQCFPRICRTVFPRRFAVQCFPQVRRTVFPTDPPHSIYHRSAAQCFSQIRRTLFPTDPPHSVSHGSVAQCFQRIPRLISDLQGATRVHGRSSRDRSNRVRFGFSSILCLQISYIFQLFLISSCTKIIQRISESLYLLGASTAIYTEFFNSGRYPFSNITGHFGSSCYIT